MENLPIKEILDHVKLAQQNQLQCKTIVETSTPEANNEFLFFLKPELTLENDSIKLEEIIKLAFQKFDEFDLTVRNIRILSASYLNNHGLIAQHYGVINKLSSDASQYVSEQGREKFRELFGKPFDDAQVFGSLEFLSIYPEFSAEALDYLWQNSAFKKLAGGTYIARFEFDSREVFIINGFHPRQLEHFTKPGRSIITFTLSGNTDWKAARNDFIGATNPGKAMEGSLRNLFLTKQEELGIPAVNGSWNGAHLSAGPVEGLVELIRYNSDFSQNQQAKPSDFQFGRKLLDAFDKTVVDQLLNNINLQFHGNELSVFDLTEEKNSDEALRLLKTALQ